MRVRDLMSKEVKSLRPKESLRDAYAWMEEFCFRHIPIVEGERVVGMLSDRDILRLSCERDGVMEVPDIPVEEAMSAEVFSCTPESSLAEAADLMVVMSIDALPVVDEEERLLGLLTSTDLLGYLAKREYES